MASVVLVAYDPLWPEEFRVEADRIARVCDDLEIRLEHVGSTSISGLSAKPIIDIAAGVAARSKREPYVQAFRELAYEHKGAFGIRGRNYFVRGNPDVMLEYQILKRQLAIAHADDRRTYTAEKGPFIQAVLRQARLTFQ